MSKLTITLDTDIINSDGFSLFAAGSPVAISGAQVVDNVITFDTDPVPPNTPLTLNYAQGNVVSSITGCALQEFTDYHVDNNIPSEFVNQQSVIHLSSSGTPGTWDGFRVYLDAETEPRWQGKATKVSFYELTDFENITDGSHSLYATTYNVVGESPPSLTTPFTYKAVGGMSLPLFLRVP